MASPQFLLRRPLCAALIACAIAALPHPAAAQQGAVAAAAPAPSEAAHRALWCGAAFTILANAPDTAPAAATGFKAKAATAFANAAAELIPNGMTVEQFKAQAESIAADVTAPFRDNPYTREQCDEAATAPAPVAAAPVTAPIPATPPAAQ